MKKILSVMIILVISIIFIILMIFYLNRENFGNITLNGSNGDEGEIIEITNEIENVDNNTDFEIVENCIQQYYDMNNNNNSNFFGYGEEGEYEKIFSDEEINQMRLDLLSKEYINKNNINLNNINQYIKTTDEKSIVIALKMKKIIGSNSDKYLVQGITVNLDYELVSEFYTFINLDINNMTFSVEPIIDNFGNIDDIEIKNENESINANDYNQYTKMVLGYEEIAKEYFTKYKMITLSSPKLMYEFLDGDYKEKRFGNLSGFEKYIYENKDEIAKIKIEEFLVNNNENSVEYVCKDQFENLYIFEETSPMNFTLKLDTYTITTDKFKDTYKTASDAEKVHMNIDKFIQMINRQDYRTSYNYISEGFKNNYFSNQNEFEQFLKDKFFLYNEIKINKLEQQSDLYICNIEITDLTKQNEEIKNISIIMKLNEETDFEMSFIIE